MTDSPHKEQDRLFVAQYARPAELQPLNIAALTPFQRVLLVIDGTVTQYIEAYMSERVEVTCLHQERITLDARDEWLEADAGTEAIIRDVRLHGKNTGKVYAYGTSIIAPQRLGDELYNGVDKALESLGRLLRENRVETHRELLWHGYEPRGVAEHPGIDGESAHISRTYRMISGGRPLMVITERFPFDSDG